MTVWMRELWRRSGLSVRAFSLVAAVFGVAMALVAIWSLAKWGNGDSIVTLPMDHVALLLGLLFSAGCAVRAVRSAHSRRHRCGWLALVVALSAWALAESIWVITEWRETTEPAWPSPVDAVLMLFSIGAPAALLLLSEGTGTHRWRLALDGVIVATSLFVVSWVFVLDRLIRDGGREGLLTLLHTVADVVLMTTAILVWSRDRPGGRVSLSLVVVGVLTISISDLVVLYMTGVGGYHTGYMVDIARLAGLAMFALAALSSIKEPPIEASLLASPSRARLWLPYAPLLLAGVTGVGYAAGQLGKGPLVAAEGLLVGAVLLRQFVVLLQNQRLLSDVSREAFHDRLTGLPNRSHFLDSVEHALNHRSDESPPIAVLCLDLDDFKTVNDALGHPAGDELLIRVAGRLTSSLGDTCTIARLGGDEFAALVKGPADDSLAAANKVLDAFAAPIVIDGVPLTVRPSIGLTLTSDGARRTVDDLLLHADLAMYAAKRDGGGCVRSFVPDMPFPYELPQLTDQPTRQANSTKPINNSFAGSADSALPSSPLSPRDQAKDVPVGVRRTPRAIWVALCALTIGLAVFAASTVLRTNPGRNVLFDSWLYDALTLSAAVLIAIRGYRVAAERWAWLLIAAGMASSATGDIVYALWVPDSKAPSIADPLYLALYPFLYAGLVLLMRARLKRVPATLRLDAVVTGLTMAAVAAALTAGPINAAMDGSPVTVLVGLAYPAGDVLLLAASVGALAILGWRTEWRWSLLVAGFIIYAIADTVYLFQTAAGTYQEGTWLDVFWPMASLTVAAAAWLPYMMPTPRLKPGVVSYVTPVVCTVIALGVCIVVNHDRLAVTLAALSLVAVAARFAVTFRDVSAVADNYRHAMTDELTGLPNRRSLAATLTTMAVDEPSTPRRARSSCALILLDIDQFREINDLADRAVGDELLCSIADRLTQSVRSEHLIARTGGDEFAVLMDGVDLTTARAQAGALVELMSEPFALEQITLKVDATFAIALCPNHCDHPLELLNRVETTMAHTKTSRSKIAVYDPADLVSQEDGDELIQELRTALSDGQLTCYYQPKVNTTDRRVHSVEALVRWHHPIRGLLLPEAFLPAAEHAGLMRQVANYVVDLALAQLKIWREEGMYLTVAVNLSTTNLLDLDLVDTIERLLDAHDLPADALILEITEGTLASDSVRSRNTVAALRRLGVRISLDDFGTGWSSLARLQNLSVDELKLDKVFVSRLARDPRSIAIVRSTVALAHSLGADLVAEGVEDVTTLRALQRYGCNITQGYVHSPPLSAAQLERWMAHFVPDRDGSAAPQYQRATVTD
jgi:diguanylate cyclase